jgi:hypothetical protein
MIKTNKGIILDSSEKEILNHAIETRQVEPFILNTIETTNKLNTWNKRLYDAFLFVVLSKQNKIK